MSRRYLENDRVGGLAWTTEHEIAFITNLGSHTPPDHVWFCPRAELLRGYLKAAHKRVNWGSIDKLVAIEFARMELATEEALP